MSIENDSDLFDEINFNISVSQQHASLILELYNLNFTHK